MSLSTEQKQALFEFLLRLGDDQIVLGHRLSEWCGHGPELEEDIALSNIALDCVGAGALFLKAAGELEAEFSGKEPRTEDQLAYFRDEIAYRNCALVEQPNGDFAMTIVRQFLFDSMSVLMFEKLVDSSFKPLAEVCNKVLKESRYHLRHSSEWLLRMGDGTEESHKRAQDALERLWTFTEELLAVDEIEQSLVDAGLIASRKDLASVWRKNVESLLTEATLSVPSDDRYMASGARQGRHTEHLGFLLAEMQILPRSYPDAVW